MADDPDLFDVVVVGGGPAGATAAADLATAGRRVALLDRAGRIKPCGGAIPPRLIRDFDIPDHLLVARATAARMIAPSATAVDMPVGDGFVGMVDRDQFDEFLRARAAAAGAIRITGRFTRYARDPDGLVRITHTDAAGATHVLRARAVIGADGARSGLARQTIRGADDMRFVFAYHEVVRSPPAGATGFDPARCDVLYRGDLSPDFYSWIFPHGPVSSIGTGSAVKGTALREAIARLRAENGMDQLQTIRREGAPIPLKPLRRWDNGRDVVLAGDAAGVVAPASGEGIYYAMLGGRLAGEAVAGFLATGRPRALATARRRFMRDHGRVFLILRIMQHVWYRNDRRRERFVTICRDPDVQRLTWEAYMNKRLTRQRPLAHLRIFFKDLAHWVGLAPT